MGNLFCGNVMELLGHRDQARCRVSCELAIGCCDLFHRHAGGIGKPRHRLAHVIKARASTHTRVDKFGQRFTGLVEGQPRCLSVTRQCQHAVSGQSGCVPRQYQRFVEIRQGGRALVPGIEQRARCNGQCTNADHQRGNRPQQRPECRNDPAKGVLNLTALLKQNQPGVLPTRQLRGYIGKLCREHTHCGVILTHRNTRFARGVLLAAEGLLDT